MSGLFIAFEGIDASGKATQSKLLAQALNATLYSFPNYETPSGQMIRSWLHREWMLSDYGLERSRLPERIEALVLQSLMLTNRMELASQMAASLAGGEILIADRYAASGMVYGASDGLDLAYLALIHSYLPRPDLYFLLDISADESFRRRPDRGGDRYEEDRSKMEDVVRRYRDLFDDRHRNNTRGPFWVTLDGTKSPDAIHQDVLAMLEAYELGR